jgi:hypothetical protein
VPMIESVLGGKKAAGLPEADALRSLVSALVLVLAPALGIQQHSMTVGGMGYEWEQAGVGILH